MKRVVGLLAEQETAGVVGEGRAGELRDALVDVREMLRAETEAAAPQHIGPETAGLGEDAAKAKVRSVSAIAFEYTLKMLMGGAPVNGCGFKVLGTVAVYMYRRFPRTRNQAET